jgi:hypothetical protein
VTQTEERSDSTVVVTSAGWVTAFVVLAAVLSLIPFLAGFLLGFSVASDVVFGFYALISGLAADLILRVKYRKALIVWRDPRIPFVVLWAVLCLYIMAFQPLG